MAKIDVPGLTEFRRLVAAELTTFGWQMYEDDGGHLMIKIDGFMDAVITATLTAAAQIAEDRENTDG